MLTITDLNRNEALSSSSMGKVVGGEDKIPGGGNGSRSEGTTGDGPDLGPDSYGVVFGLFAAVESGLAAGTIALVQML
jgi:hypothetical protein